MTAKSFFTYLLLCSDGTWYAGWTVNMEKRIEAHNAGTASRYTRFRRPVSLLRCWSWASKSEAMSAEVAIKKLPRRDKEALIDGVKELVSVHGKVSPVTIIDRRKKAESDAL